MALRHEALDALQRKDHRESVLALVAPGRPNVVSESRSRVLATFPDDEIIRGNP